MYWRVVIAEKAEEDMEDIYQKSDSPPHTLCKAGLK